MSDLRHFESKRVLITGGAGGIGQCVARKLVDNGARVIITDQSEDALDEIATQVDLAATLAGDLSDAHFCAQLPDEAARRLGGLDIVINNAGIIRRGNILDTSDADWTDTMSVNVDAVFRICRAAIALMTEQNTGGAIVNVSSCWGLYPGPEHVAYCTSKAAVAAMTRCLGRDHAHSGIRINAVAPNEVDTPMLRSGFTARGLDPTTAIQALNATVPLGRVATPDDIAEVMLFLASDQSRYICGECIEINGAKPVD